MLISIIVPCFNAEEWIRPSIQSLTLQTYSNIEILAYDDGSSDSTGEILCSLAKQDNRIKVISNSTNSGIVNALNVLVEKSNGTYIARMDADDIAHPRRMERQLDWLTHKRVDLCGTWFKEIGEGPERVTRWPTSHEALEAALLFQNSICHPTIMAKRQVFYDFSYRDAFNLAEDYDFFVRAMQKYKLANMPEALLNYRRHPAQATQAKKDEMERITKIIRINALENIGIHPTTEESRIHHLVRAPHSINSIEDLNSIEQWLLLLLNDEKSLEFNSTIASQWVRACIRAAPLGLPMIKKFQSSPLLKRTRTTLLTHIDIAAIAALRLDYNSGVFKMLRRIGLSA